jgi:hypothetical protein
MSTVMSGGKYEGLVGAIAGEGASSRALARVARALYQPNFKDRPPGCCSECWSRCVRLRQTVPAVCAHRLLERRP